MRDSKGQTLIDGQADTAEGNGQCCEVLSPACTGGARGTSAAAQNRLCHVILRR